MSERITITNAQRSELAEVISNAAERKDEHSQYNAGFIDGVTQACDILDITIGGVGAEMSKKYIVIITDEHMPFASYRTEDVKVDFLSVGTVFHGRHFNGNRPNILIDQTTGHFFDAHIGEWAEHVISGLSTDVRVIGLGVVAQVFQKRYGKRIFNTRNFAEFERKAIT